uniref:Lethal giant larvae homologue 2 domain-containing protein n=1 Tax=Ditylenchus dipsaci TaxID=166011 RepID=A0A915DF09_9BILA
MENLTTVLIDSIERIFTSPIGLTDMCVIGSSNKLFCSRMDGSYTVFPWKMRLWKRRRITAKPLLSKNSKILLFLRWNALSFYGDRYTLSLMSDEKVVVLDFESPVLDFVVLCDCDNEHIASALFVLCEQELVVIDLKDHSWPMFALPHFNCIHSSPITTTAIFCNISKCAYTRLCELHQQQSRRSALSKRRWPLKCGNTFSQTSKSDEIAWKEATLLFTGHENGCVSIWLTNSLSLSRGSLSTQPMILKVSQLREIERRRPGMAPIKKAGVFDSCADDHRLSIVKVMFDVESAEIVVGGRAGQILVYEPILASKAAGAPHLVIIDMIEGSGADAQPNSRGIRNKNTALPPRTVGNGASTAFSLAFNTLLQFQPVVPVSALAWLANQSMLAVGNEFGKLSSKFMSLSENKTK